MMTHASSLRVVFLGMSCDVSAITLHSMLDAEFDVTAVFLAGSAPSDGDRGMQGPERHPVPTRTLTGIHGSATQSLIAARRPDLIVVSCFPWRLPSSLLGLPRLGCINVHPSLLPTGRGPEPVFWTLRRGERETGATIYLMDEELDTGPILAQEHLLVPPGIRAPDLERRLAALGGRLLVPVIAELAAGTARPGPQNPAAATPAPVPSDDDYLIPANLPASWAYNFARGVSPLNGPLAVWIGATKQRIPVRDALAWDGEPMDTAFVENGDTITVRFAAGRVTFQRAER